LGNSLLAYRSGMGERVDVPQTGPGDDAQVWNIDRLVREKLNDCKSGRSSSTLRLADGLGAVAILIRVEYNS